MNRASPVDLRKASEVAAAMAKAGILFVPMPVLDSADTIRLQQLAGARLDVLIEELDAPEGIDSEGGSND